MDKTLKHILMKAIGFFIFTALDILFLIGSIIFTCASEGAMWWTIPLSIAWIIASTWAIVEILVEIEI
jgi:hypothetical protein